LYKVRSSCVDFQINKFEFETQIGALIKDISVLIGKRAVLIDARYKFLSKYKSDEENEKLVTISGALLCRRNRFNLHI
jgi:hypothetical protein